MQRKGHADILEEYEKLKIQHNRKRKNVGDTGEGCSSSKTLKQSTLPAILPKSVNFDKLLVNFLVETMSPISIVENKSFKALIEGAQQLSVPPKIMCRQTCNKKIAEQYTEYIENTKEQLRKVDFICTTADIWSSSKRSYLGVTAHWIDCDKFNRKSVTLACRRFKGTHSYDKVAELIAEIHSEFDLKLSKIIKTITDNGSNMVKAFRIYGQDSDTGISKGTLMQNIDVMHDNIDDGDDDDDNVLTLRQFSESFEEFDELQLPNHERCATHTLHLIASQDMDKARSQSNSYKKMYDTAMAKCRAVWNLCSRSPKACEIYLESTGKSPTYPCPTRWNSYYNCIQDLLAVKGTLNETFKKLGLPIFKEIEIQFLLEYVSCSKPIADGIRSLEGDKDTYYGCLIPELMRMQRILSSLKMDNLTYCDVLIDVITESLNRRFERFYKLEEPKAKDGIIASVSYPFFKMKWVPKANREYIKEVFVSEVRKIKQEDEKSSQHTDSYKKKERTESYYMFVEDSDSSAASDNVNTTTIDLETLQYLKDEDNTLESLNRYPTVKKLFLKYNTCLPSSAPVERLFSFGGMIMRPHRRNMKDELFEQILVLKSVQ